RNKGRKRFRPRYLHEPIDEGVELAFEVEQLTKDKRNPGRHPRLFLDFDTDGGHLAFAPRPADAPVVRLGDGCWSLALNTKTHTWGPHVPDLGIIRGEEAGTLSVLLGCQGSGRGTFAYVHDPAQLLVPGDVHPTVEIAYPPAREGSAPRK